MAAASPVVSSRILYALASSLSPSGAAALSSVADKAVKLPSLDYDYGALEPFISGDIMRLHHSKHHQAYVNNFNVAVQQYAEAEARKDIRKMIELQPALRFNGGGHLNHTMFWTNLAPPSAGGGKEPEGVLKTMIDAGWGNFAAFKKDFSTKSVAVQGSGWGWLVFNAPASRLEIHTTSNQDPITAPGLTPIFCVDVWEHAYYLQYKNVRADYLDAVWGVANFANVADRLDVARRS